MENTKQPTRRFSYIIRTKDKTYFTMPEQTLNKTLKRTECALVQLASTGELSIQDVGTILADCRRFINDIKERDQQTSNDRKSATAQKRRDNRKHSVERREGESDADFKKRKHALYAYESWLRKRDAKKEKQLAINKNTPSQQE